MFLTDIHEEADYQDVFNLLDYSSVTDVPPALTCVNYYTQDHIERIGGNPVAIMSLFRERDDVFKVPGTYAYRVTGVLEASLALPESLKNFHMVLEYDKGAKDLIAIAEEVEDVEIADRNRYKSVETPTMDLNDDAMDI